VEFFQFVVEFDLGDEVVTIQSEEYMLSFTVLPGLFIPFHQLIQLSYLLTYQLLVRQFFTARCTLVQSAVLRSHVVCLSVCL